MFRKLFQIVAEGPFIIATGLAALVHSTWSLGTIFTGPEPVQFTGAWFAWLVPAFLIAFSLDVGQIAVSADIRAGHRQRAKYATFVILALSTYYLQWTYLVHHVPLLALSAGVREEWRGGVAFIRDVAIWFVPALLPLSTTLYTFSFDGKRTGMARRPANVLTVTERKVEVKQVAQPDAPLALEAEATPDVPARTGMDDVAAWFAANPDALEQIRAGALSLRQAGRLIGTSHTTVGRYVKSREG